MCNLYVFHLIIIITFIINISSNIIVIPFKILQKCDMKNISNSDPLEFLDNIKDTTIYTNILLGEPPQNITSIISLNVEDFSMHHKINNNLFNDTLYKRSNSKTFEKLENIYNDPSLNKEYFKEQVLFYTDLNFKNKIKIKDLLFSLIEYRHEKIEKNDSSLCINIGFQLSENSKDDLYNKKLITNIVVQLKEKNIISSYNFNIHFNNFKINEENFDGFIVIGNEPHNYLKDLYNEYQLFKTLAFKKDKNLSWDIHFNKIFYKSQYKNQYNSYEIIIDNQIDFYNQATLTPSSSLIVGTNNYEKKIKFDFFDELISLEKCKRENKKFTIIYYCYKNKITKEDLEKFPTLYFFNVELDYTFELNYEDLFLEKNDLIYFLVIFYDFPEDAQNYLWTYISRWEMGTPFMKKYFFTYDYDNKYIGFYNNKKIIQNKINNFKKKNKNNIIIIMLVIIINIIMCIFVRKKIFKNKKISAIELENNIININVDKYNYYNVEMKKKIVEK